MVQTPIGSINSKRGDGASGARQNNLSRPARRGIVVGAETREVRGSQRVQVHYFYCSMNEEQGQLTLKTYYTAKNAHLGNVRMRWMGCAAIIIPLTRLNGSG